MSPIPILNTMRQIIGTISKKKLQVKVTPSKMQKMMNIRNVNPKLIRDEMFREKRKRYLGTFTFLKIDEFAKREVIPPLLASEK